MKISASNTQLVQQKLDVINNVVENIKTTKNQDIPSFSERLNDGLNQVATKQKDAAQLAKNFELGVENDLARVMV